MKFKVGYEVKARYTIPTIIKIGDTAIITKIEKNCDCRSNDKCCNICPGKIQIENTSFPDCWGYGKGFLWEICKIKNWRSRICKK